MKQVHWSKAGDKQEFLRPEGQIRQSQVVTTFGPGALVDLVDQAVLVSGLDFWRLPAGTRSLVEPRLRDSLARRLLASDVRLNPDRPFLEPPKGDDQEPTYASGIEVLEFPRWFACQNEHCRALVRSDGLERKSGRYVHFCERGKRTEAVPVRFVGACRNGHVDDFPWIDFCHAGQRGGERCAAPSLKLEEGATGDFSEIVVRCESCGASERLSTAFAGNRPPCTGERPWLGSEGNEGCDQRIRLMVRTASNVYFPQVVSALSVPSPGGELAAAIDAVWDVLKSVTAETLPVFRTIEKVRIALEGFADDEVLAAVLERREGAATEVEPLRSAEYRQLTSQAVEQPGDLPKASDIFFARRAAFDGALPAGIGPVVLVKKLREVRAQVGFTRLEPAVADLQGEYDLDVRSQQLGLTADWLPATEILGEGIFLQLDEVAVREWEARPAVQARSEELQAGYDRFTVDKKDPPPFPGIRFYLLHSLSHLLMGSIADECGYAASAIRERIYCAPAGDKLPMAGILLSTGTAGNDGTLGGLVEQGRVLHRHLRRAWDEAVLCSNDPVCARHSPRGDLEERYLEGAACHGCLFIAECSCERFNRHLDRALVAPTLGHDPALAFFRDRPGEP
ncbi:MAG TPA: DUF1998 domain-containing protein [Thermoanaerobaculia bacterium]|nr:DUF1998 domain-containing protein [Thermoanaerobaculia bacterium]